MLKLWKYNIRKTEDRNITMRREAIHTVQDTLNDPHLRSFISQTKCVHVHPTVRWVFVNCIHICICTKPLNYQEGICQLHLYLYMSIKLSGLHMGFCQFCCSWSEITFSCYQQDNWNAHCYWKLFWMLSANLEKIADPKKAFRSDSINELGSKQYQSGTKLGDKILIVS